MEQFTLHNIGIIGLAALKMLGIFASCAASVLVVTVVIAVIVKRAIRRNKGTNRKARTVR